MGMKPQIVRVQTGVRIERNLLKVLKALAEYKDMSVGDLIEGIVLHAFEGEPPFSAETRARIETLKGIYGLELTAKDAHAFPEPAERPKGAGTRRTRRSSKA
jgi:hypothetical protein